MAKAVTEVLIDKSLHHRKEMNMVKDSEIEKEKQKGVASQKQGEKRDNLIIAVFKILLGFNYLKMGTKKDF